MFGLRKKIGIDSFYETKKDEKDMFDKFRIVAHARKFQKKIGLSHLEA